jgi:hypothetical protein
MRIIVEMDMGSGYPILSVGNRPATATWNLALSPPAMLALLPLVPGEGRRLGVVVDQQIGMAMRVKALGEQHQRAQNQRQKRRCTDIDCNYQGDRHVR